MSEAIERLKAMLKWSDRIGSDEIYEIETIIKLLEQTTIETKVNR